MKPSRIQKLLPGLLLAALFIGLSVSVSWAVAKGSQHSLKKDIKPKVKPVDYSQYSRNSAILKSFINNTSDLSAPTKNRKLQVILKLKEARENLRKPSSPKSLPSVLRKPLPKDIPLKRKYNNLKLNYLFRLKKYSSFVKLYEKTGTSSMGIKYLYSLIRTGKTDKTGKVFKRLFKTKSLNHFKPWISSKRLKKYLASISYDEWFKKFSYLINRGRYYEFRRESRYSRTPQLTNLFTAEHNYRRKRYTKARYYLRRVRAKKLQPHKSKLLIKMDLRQERPTAFLKRIEKLSPHKALYSQLLYDAGSINLIKNRLKDAASAFNRFMVKVSITDPRYPKVVWLNGWVQVRQNNIPAAISLFDKCAKLKNSSYSKASLYWSGTLNKDKSKKVKSPFNYYYAVNNMETRHQELHKYTIPFKNLLNQKISPSTEQQIPFFKTLLKLGEIDVAIELLNEEIFHNKEIKEGDRRLLVLIKSIILAKDKNYFDSYVSFRKGIRSYQDFILPEWLKLITMPDEYLKQVLKYSKIYKVDPHLVLALIRQESLFNPRTRSHANAYGLMQLLPRTARQMAGRRRRLKRHQLYIPDINIKYGTKYLSLLLKKYDNRTHLALAAYNAGDHRVDKWLPEIGGYQKEMMIELIPFSETRSYVKNIIRNYFYYRYYYPNLPKPKKG